MALLLMSYLEAKEEVVYRMLDVRSALNIWSLKLGMLPPKLVVSPQNPSQEWMEVYDNSDKGNTAVAMSVDIKGVKEVKVKFSAMMPERLSPQVVIIVFYDGESVVLDSPNERWIDSRPRKQVKEIEAKNYSFSAKVPPKADSCEVYIAGYKKEISRVWYRDFEVIVEKGE